MLLQEKIEVVTEETTYLRKKLEDYRQNEETLMERNKQLARGKDFGQEDKITILENRLQEREIINYDQDYDKEIQLQDMMIKGYQMDNQKLLSENRALRDRLDKLNHSLLSTERQKEVQFREQAQLIGQMKDREKVDGESKVMELKKEYAMREELEKRVFQLEGEVKQGETRSKETQQTMDRQQAQITHYVQSQEKIQDIKEQYKVKAPQCNQYSEEVKKIRLLEKKIEMMEKVFNKRDSAMLRKINQTHEATVYQQKIDSMKLEMQHREHTWQDRLRDIQLDYDQIKIRYQAE